MTPAISVILPVRNGGAWLREAVDSVLSSEFTSLELLLVDDHSDDGAVDSLSARDSRLTILRNPGQGVSSAFNHGLDHARGVLIARMDADDVALPERFGLQADYLDRNSGVDICGGQVKIVSEGPIAGGFARYQDWLNSCVTPEQIHREMFVECPVPNPTSMFRRETIMELSGYRDTDWPEDYDLFLRADGQGIRMGKPSGTVLHWREHGERVTHRQERYSIANFQAAKAHYLVADRLQGRPVVIWGAGPTGRNLHDLLKAEGAEISGFLEVHPRRIGGTKRDLPVWGIEKIGEVGEAIVLVAVGSAGARDEIREWLQKRDKVELQDFLMVA